MDIVEKSDNIQMVKKGTWALSNLVRGDPLPKFELVKETIPMFSKIIKETEDFETLIDAVWAMGYLSDAERKQNSLGRSVFDSSVCQGLVAHIKSALN